MKIPTYILFVIIYDMFECENQDSCLLYLNGHQRNICYNHDQITYSQGIVRHSLNFGAMFLNAQESKTLTDIVGV